MSSHKNQNANIPFLKSKVIYAVGTIIFLSLSLFSTHYYFSGFSWLILVQSLVLIVISLFIYSTAKGNLFVLEQMQEVLLKTNDGELYHRITNTKGLGEKVMTILFNNNIVTFKEALSKGAKGLVELPGIGPKKATGVIELAEKIQERVAAAQVLTTEVENPEAPDTEQSDDVTEKDQKKMEELEESIQQAASKIELPSDTFENSCEK